MSEIINLNKSIKLSKRFYLPGVVIKSKCLNCKKEMKRDLGDDYLSYPETNKSESVYFYCNDCDIEFEEKIIIKLSVELIKE